ncbi:MAG: glycosyltransferase family 39 protein [Gammaproteobacteria bacterium]
MSSSRARAVFFLLCLLVFGVIWFWGIGHRPLFTTDEGRYAEIPREMLVTGNWVTPRLNGLRYFEKPPLQYWMTAAAFAVFGVHDWAARIATTTAGFLTVLFAGFTAFKLYGRRAGWLTTAVLAGSFYFGFLGHFNTLDAVLCLMMSMNLFGFLLAQRAPPGSRAELGWMLVSWAGAALAVLDKGLIGIILPGVVFVLYLFIKRDWGLVRRLRLLSGLTLFFAMTLPWFIAVSIANHDFLWQFFMVQQFLRFLTPAQHRPGPWWYFIPFLVLAVVPWLVAAARALWRPLRRLGRRGAFDAGVLLWLWIVFIFLFFSASHSKLPSYILPIIPAFALLIGRALSRKRALPWVAAAISLVLGAAVLVLGILAARVASHADPAMLAAFRPWVVAAGIVILATTVAAIFARGRLLVAVTGIAVAWLIANRLVMLGGAAFGPEYSTRAMAAAVARYNRPGVPIFSVDGYQQTLPFYLRRKMILVGYRGEMDFGIRNARGSLENRYLPSLADFAARWRAEPDALAFVPRKKVNEMQALGISCRVVAGNARWVALVHGGEG